MIRVAIVEDNLTEAKNLDAVLQRYGKAHDIQFQSTHFENAIQFLDQYQPKYELIFMDIDMPYLNGVEATKKLRQIDDKVVLMFVTALAQYTLQGYGVVAVDLLIKPVK